MLRVATRNCRQIGVKKSILFCTSSRVNSCADVSGAEQTRQIRPDKVALRGSERYGQKQSLCRSEMPPLPPL